MTERDFSLCITHLRLAPTNFSKTRKIQKVITEKGTRRETAYTVLITDVELTHVHSQTPHKASMKPTNERGIEGKPHASFLTNNLKQRILHPQIFSKITNRP